jgi:uncharacterized membrane protein
VAFVLALGSAALYGAADFLGGLASRRVNTLSIVIVSQLAGLLLLVAMLPLLPSAAPVRSDLTWGAVAGLMGGTGVALLYRALAIGTMAIVAPTTAVCAVAIPVLASIALGERPAPLTFGGIALAVMAIVLVSRQGASEDDDPPFRGGGRGVPRGLGIALLSGVAIGLFFLALARTSASAGMWPLVAARLTSGIFFFALAVAAGRGLRMDMPVLGTAIAAGCVDMLANALYLAASRSGPLSTVVTLSSLYPASTVLLARSVLGERLTRWQTAGIGCALVAVALIVSSSS